MENLKAKSFDLRKDTVDIIVAGKGGHIGGDMSVIDTLMSLYFCQMNISPENMDDPNRDRFVLSKGHSVEAYYAVLAAKGFLDLEDIKAHFSKFGSKYIGHPNNKLPGIEMNSGSLGHGLPVCVGMALQISGNTEDVMGHDDLHERIRSFGWHVIDVKDGNDIDQLNAAFEEAKTVKGKPTAVIANTVKGCGSSVMENKANWHHKVPTQEEYDQIIADFAARKEAALHE